jgi:hypothetical protein
VLRVLGRDKVMTKPAFELTLPSLDRPIMFEGLGGRTKLVSWYLTKEGGDYFEDKDEIKTIKPAHW